MSKSFLNYTISFLTIRRLFISLGILTSLSLVAQTIPFNINSPDKVLNLDNQLIEISGITMMPEDSVIIAEQDENGIIYYLDKNTGKILRQFTIERTGDFEDIAFVYPNIYLMKSRGTLFSVKHNNFKDIKTFNTAFGKEDDIEGMCYDPLSKQLLIACKANRPTSNIYERDIYRYNLKTNSLSDKPFITIKKSAIVDFLRANKGIQDYEKLWSNYNDNNQEFHLGPSGVAVDPISNDIYVISSVGKVLMIFDSAGTLKNIVKLDKDIFSQPEGITFDSKGNLYISNEGKVKKGIPGNILYFNRNK